MAIRDDISRKDFCFYVIAQIFGAVCGSATIGAIRGGYAVTGANIVEAGYLATLDNKGVAYTCAFVMELLLTFLFVLAVLGVTADDKFSQVGDCLVIGMALTGAHLVGDGITNTSVNPARSLSAAIFSPLVAIWMVSKRSGSSFWPRSLVAH